MGEDPRNPAGETSYHVGRARKGDQASLEWLIRRLSPLLLSQANYRLGKRLRELYDPEDIVNDVWLATIPRLAELSTRDGRATPVVLKYLSTTLLYRINNLIEKHIKNKPKKAKAAAGQTSQGDPVDKLSAEITGCVTRIFREEKKSAITDALLKVPDKDREILILRGIEGRAYKDISPLVGRDHKVLAVEYQRALKKLKHELPDSVFVEFDDEPEVELND